MSETADLLNEIENKTGFINRKDFIDWVRIMESRYIDGTKTLIMSGWKPGKGLDTANSLSKFRDLLLKKIIGFSGGIKPGITVLAVGGYGRGELSPYSDIDLLILHSEKAEIKKFTHDFVTLMWDCGYHMGYSVRTPDNLAAHAREDIEFLTSLFEARFIDGETALYMGMEESLKKIILSFRINYLKSQMEQLNSLIRDPANEILLKEPDIKKSIGGLRSVHLMEWLNYAFTLNKGLPGLKNVLPSMYFRKTCVAYDFMLYIRCILHTFSGRKNDRLLMEEQFSISGILFPTIDKEKGTMKLMRKYYDKSLDIFLSLLFIIDEFHLRYIKGVKNLKSRGKTPGTHFIVYNRRFYVGGNARVSVENAFEAIYLCCKTGCLFTFSLIHYLKECTRLLNDEKRRSRDIFYNFRRIMSLENASNALAIMKYSGLLYEYLPLFKKIRHLLIYNPYHQFTVDQHALEAVHALKILELSGKDPASKGKFSHFIEVYSYYRKNTWILRLALLFHDIGKAYEGDHSKNGVEMAGEMLSVLPVKPMARGLILFLIDNHLLLSNIVRRSNIMAEDRLADLAGRFIMTPFPKEYFEALYIMTYCDIYATKPGNLKGYMAELLTLLYKNMLPYLLLKTVKKESRNMPGYGVPENEKDAGIADFIKEMGLQYSIQNREGEIRSDYKIINSIGGSDIKINVRGYNDYFKIKLFAGDKKGLFSFFCGVLALNGADIVRAVIRTYKGIAVDEFTVTRIFGIDFKEDMLYELNVWTHDLEKLLDKFRLDRAGLDNAIGSMKKRIKNPPEVFHRKAEVTLSEKSGSGYMLEISGMDRPALLYDAALYITENGLEIQSAHIDTMGWYVHDIFELKRTPETGGIGIDLLRDGLLTILEANFNG